MLTNFDVFRHKFDRDNIEQNNRSMILAIETNKPEIVRFLVDSMYIDLTWENNQFIILACDLGHTAIAEMLLNGADKRITPGLGDISNQVDINTRGNLPFLVAVENGNIDILKLLFRAPNFNPTNSINEAFNFSDKNEYI